MGSEDGASVVGITVGVGVGAPGVGSIAVGLVVGNFVGEPVVGAEGICDGNPVGTGLGGSMHGPQYPSPGLWHGTGSGSMRQC